MIYSLCHILLTRWCRVISSSGGSTLANLLQALEDYLPVLLGLVKDGKSCVCSLVHDVCSMYFISRNRTQYLDV